MTIWIGGGSGAGKSTVARRLVRRHGLRLYAADTRTWAHRDRAVTVPGDRFLDDPDDVVALHRERGQMVVDDLRALGSIPTVVAEGTVLPASAADPERSVWLLPTPEHQARHRSDAWGPALTGVIAAEAEAHGIPTFVVDGSLTIDALVEEVERRLAGTLAGTIPGDRRALLREANLAIVEQVRGWATRPWADRPAGGIEQRFLCECGDPACVEEPVVTTAVAAVGPVLAPGHR